MNLSSAFIHRPVATTLIAIAFLVVGIASYLSLPVAALPNVDFPTIHVSALLPGASPETMASNVATPLERQFSLITGITQMTSVSSLGSTSITLQFELTQNINTDFEQIQAAITAASAQLPSNLPSTPTLSQVNPADAPIMILSLSSDAMPLSQVDNYADVILSQQISRIQGVGLVTLGGQQKPAVRIRIDPRKVAALGLQIDNVKAKIVASTINAPKGVINGASQNLTVYANDQILDASAWNRLVVGYHNGAAIRIKDLGDAIEDVENDQIGAWAFPGKANTDASLKGGQSVLLIIYKLPGVQRHSNGERHSEGASGASGRNTAGYRHSRLGGSHPDHPLVSQRCGNHACHLHCVGDRGDLPIPARYSRDADSQRRYPFGVARNRGRYAAA